MFQSLLFSLLLIIGIFSPSSNNIFLLASFFLLILLSFLIYQTSIINKKGFLIAIGINLSLWFSTIIGPFTEYRYGTSVYYLALSMVYCLNLKEIILSNSVIKVFSIVNFVNIVLGFAIVTGNASIMEFFIEHYSAFYPELLPNMMFQNKPVLTFGSHSIAGFFLYLFFFLCLTTYKFTNSKTYMIYSLSYLVLLYNLNSVTAFILLGLGISQIIFFLSKERKKTLYFITIGTVLSSFFYLDEISAFINAFIIELSSTFNSSGNGLLGRYSANGNLSQNFQYISNNPFRPVGFSYSPSISYVDSGYVEYLTRGSIILVLLMYTGLFLFLKINLKSKLNMNIVFISFLLFEIGFSGLIYLRTIYFLPFIVVYLNTIEKKGFSIENPEFKWKLRK